MLDFVVGNGRLVSMAAFGAVFDVDFLVLVLMLVLVLSFDAGFGI